MKSFKILAGAFVAMVLSITACQKEIPVVGVDPTKPAPEDVAIDLETSTTNTLTVQWDVTKAAAAGAVSFTAQIPAEQDLGDVYDKAKSITVFTADEINNFVTFSKLNAYDQFYVRVRANYPRSVFSEWVYISIAGEPAKYEMGHGLLNAALPTVESIDYNEALSASTTVAMDVESSAAEAKGATVILTSPTIDADAIGNDTNWATYTPNVTYLARGEVAKSVALANAAKGTVYLPLGETVLARYNSEKQGYIQDGASAVEAADMVRKAYHLCPPKYTSYLKNFNPAKQTTGDTLHLNHDGANAMAGIIAGLIENSASDLKGFLK